MRALIDAFAPVSVSRQSLIRAAASTPAV
jgi:hypothetical protein